MSNFTFPLILTLHVLGATIWTGGHLILALRFLPQAWHQQDLEIISEFEEKYEPIGLTALALQIVTGIWLAAIYIPNWSSFWDYHDPISRDILIKSGLLLLTLILSLDARLRLIPNLELKKLPSLTAHIIAVTILSVLLVIFGVALRVGGI